ncbi:hypothetical protein BVZ43_01662B, partial [Haemophilus influenzae]
PNPISI